MNQISVIIPTYNSGEHFEENVSTIRKLALLKGLDVEIIVVDAGSRDETIKTAEKYADKVIVISGISRGRARNVGADIAENETLAFIDSDCKITESWITFVNNLHSIDSEMISGPTVLCESDTVIGEAIRNLLSDPIFTLDSYTFSAKKSRKERVKEVPASNLLISEKMFKKIGGFPDLNFNEDTFFCKMFREHGGTIIYEPDLKCVHYKHFNLKYFSKYFFTYGERYAKIAKSLGAIRRYALVSLIFFGILIFLGISFVLGLIEPIYFWIPLALGFLVLVLYLIIRNRKLFSIIIPVLFFILLFSYAVGFCFGIIKTKE